MDILNLFAFTSFVIFKHGCHITRADYMDTKPLLGSENIKFPKIDSLQARALRRLFPAGVMQSHRDFDFVSRSYRLSAFIHALRNKGWPIVDHDEVCLTKDIVKRKAKFTPELFERINEFCKAVDEFEAMAKVA